MNRLRELRERALKKDNFSEEFYLHFYRKYEELNDLPEYEKYGEAFYHAFSLLTPSISDGELIVGKRDKPLSVSDEKDWNEKYRRFTEERSDIAGGGQDSHMAIDYELLLSEGISGIISRIDALMTACSEDKLPFYRCCKRCLEAVIKHSENYAREALRKSFEADSPERKRELLKISEICERVPKNPAESFYEAVLSIYVCYPYLPDSIGVIDRFLKPYYDRDLEKGVITPEKAKEYLQELYLMLQSKTEPQSIYFYRGGESHFCVGGYLADGSDGFTDFSRLVVEALLDLPTWIPQISLRWTKKTPTEVLRFMLDCERKDQNKRIAFVNDEPRLKGLTEYSGFSYDDAIEYSMIGCNELSLPGGMVLGFDPINLARSMANLFHEKGESVENVQSFDEFYNLYEQELFADLREAMEIGGGMQAVRNRDCNIVSNFLLDGPIKNAKSATQGGLDKITALGLLIGITTVIDSLTVVKQFVFDEKKITMKELISALKNDWQGFETLHLGITKTAKYFGNDEEISNGLAQRFFESIYKWNDGNNYMGKKLVFGNLIGYNEHDKFFGDATGATPDGRKLGDRISFGIGQTGGRDRKGVSALLKSVAQCDPKCLLTGPSVTNVYIDEQLIKNDDNFEKLVLLFETYFKNGGTHFQLTYVSKEDLIAAKETPENYKNLRVRVSGFSDYFNFLNDALQDEIILRTEHTK